MNRFAILRHGDVLVALTIAAQPWREAKVSLSESGTPALDQ